MQINDYIKEQNQELSLSVYKKNDRAVDFYLREKFNNGILVSLV